MVSKGMAVPSPAVPENVTRCLSESTKKRKQPSPSPPTPLVAPESEGINIKSQKEEAQSCLRVNRRREPRSQRKHYQGKDLSSRHYPSQDERDRSRSNISNMASQSQCFFIMASTIDWNPGVPSPSSSRSPVPTPDSQR